MSHKTAHRDYLKGVAEFHRALQQFSSSVAGVVAVDVTHQPEAATDSTLGLGPRKPAKRAPRRDQPARPRVKRAQHRA